MSNILGHSILHKTPCHPSIVDGQIKTHHRISANLCHGTSSASESKCALNSERKALLSNKFLGNNAALKVKLSKGLGVPAISMAPRAVLITDPSSELVGKFNLHGQTDLQMSINTSSAASTLQVKIEITNSTGSEILHWGALYDNKKNWSFPSSLPNDTKMYKNRALRTPFIKSGSNSYVDIEINESDIQAIEFLIFDEAQNKWFKNNGQNYQVVIPRGNEKSSTILPRSDQEAVIPEEFVQIQAYLRWERKGKQNYTPSQEKEEYEAARSELLDEISKGTTISELYKKLTKSNDTTETEKPQTKDKPQTKIPDELVQVQAYIRWENAGKPTYSQEKQLMEFKEARKDLQLQLDNGATLDEIQKRLIKGDITKKVSKLLKKNKYFSVERVQRKKRDVMQLINKFPSQAVKVEEKLPPKVETDMELFSKAKLEQGNDLVLNKKIFKLGNKELLALVMKSEGKTKICVATDRSEPLVLRWGLSRKAGEWTVPSSGALPPQSVLVGESCETPFTKMSSENPTYQVQVVEIEIDDGNFIGMPFVLREDENWIKNNSSDFYVELLGDASKSRKEAGDGKGTAKFLLERIAELESEAQKSFMHRFNIAADLVESAQDAGELGFAGLLVWMRFMATRQLIWNKNYNVKPREISKAQDRLTDVLQRSYERCPSYREILRMIMSTVGRGGEGDVGQRIRDEILVIQRNNDCKGGMMEEWHQKLHNNTSPDDVVICQALIDYVKSDFNMNVYWETLNSNGITKERLLSYDRAIHSEPSFRKDQKNGLLHDLGNYMRTLKAVHSGADLESAIATCMGYKSEGQGFMVGVQINAIKGLPSGLPESLKFILDHVEDKEVEYLLEGLLEARMELQPLLMKSHERLKDLIFLDIALDSTVRTAVERGYEELNKAEPEKLMYFITLVLENLAISSDNNEDLIYCLKGWNRAIEMFKHKEEKWALFAKSCLDRTRLALSSKAEQYQSILQPSAEYLGSLLGVDQWAVSIFTEEMIRGGSAASLSALLNRLDPVLRKVANLGSWQVISPVEVAGYVVTVDELLAVQNRTYERPTILVAKSVKGDEEIPDGAVAVVTPDMPDVLSHVSVRARNGKICFATCFDPNILNDLQQKEGKYIQLKPTSADVVYGEVEENKLDDANLESLKEDSSATITLARKQFRDRYAITAQEFTSDLVGAKSRNIAYLKGKVPSWIGIPTSIALPFGSFEKVLSDDLNQAVDRELHILNEKLERGEFEALAEIRRTVLRLTAPPQLVLDLKTKMQESGMPWPGDEGAIRWEQAWLAIKKVWASKWNERAYFSTRKLKVDHKYLCMAVLVQEIISADYAFVIHTTNPSSGDSTEIYAEVVKGLGETLVGAYPGRAMSFICKKNDLNSPMVLGYPSKPIGLFIKPSLIFRSDSNGEDLEGYAGAGLYDSVPMDSEDEVVLDYTSDPLIIDAHFRTSVLSSIAQAGNVVEQLYGSPQDIEGVVKDGKIYIVQTRPQV